MGCPPKSLTYYVSVNSTNRSETHNQKVFSLNYANREEIEEYAERMVKLYTGQEFSFKTMMNYITILLVMNGIQLLVI